MCNRYASDIRKAGMEKEYYGFEEWSETRIDPMLGNAVLEVFPKSFGPVIRMGAGGAREWAKMRWGLPGPQATGGAPVTNIRNIKARIGGLCLERSIAVSSRSPPSANAKTARQRARRSSAGSRRPSAA